MAECQATYEQRDGLGENPFVEIHPTNTAIRADQAKGVIDCLSNAEPFFSMGNRLTERTDFGKAQGQPGAREDGGKARHTNVLMGQVACERRDDLPEHLYAPAVVPTGIVDNAQVDIRDDLRAQIVEGLREGKSVPAGLDGTVKVAHHPEIIDHVEGDPAQPAVI